MNPSKRSNKEVPSTEHARTSAIIPNACFHRNRGIFWLAGSLIAVAAISAIPTRSAGVLQWLAPVAEAQSFSQRIIQGKVVDDTGTLVAGATVFLKNDKTRNVKSFTSTSDGSFRFAQVGMLDDYDLWAEHGSHKSSVKTVSSFDSRKQVEYELKLK